MAGLSCLLTVVAWTALTAWVYAVYIPRKMLEAGLSKLFSQSLGAIGSDDGGMSDAIQVAVQEITRDVWTLLMALAALTTVWAGTAAIAGTKRARTMLAIASLINLVCAAATAGGMEILHRWGGFPPVGARDLLVYGLVLAMPSLGVLVLTQFSSPRPCHGKGLHGG